MIARSRWRHGAKHSVDNDACAKGNLFRQSAIITSDHLAGNAVYGVVPRQCAPGAAKDKFLHSMATFLSNLTLTPPSPYFTLALAALVPSISREPEFQDFVVQNGWDLFIQY